ncbi:hypothetical protein GCM10023347_47560 [Streptomyces chumphonensis]|uniref:Transmembrane transport protein n=1 Tax=Streptomyces chumphonensis TaxID=1214925 RepID=A0A927IE33_9ACTN|nr:transmembrane transport protein [Streptomyces chumphonensis]MBD3932926.1 transmembrane transport protein [Streptomyces chumphonensis]
MNEHDRRNPGDRRPAPREVPEELVRTLARETSLGRRVRHLATGLAGGCGAALLTLLWATEPAPLPLRTRVAFAGLIAVGLAWAALACWTLTRRHPLYGADRVLAAGVALGAASATALGAVVLAAVRGTAALAVGTGVAGALAVTAAALLLGRARGRRRALLDRRDALRAESGVRD